MPSILVVGAGIAGDTLAVFLGRAGWEVTVVEIAPALRAGGQTVDLRGDSREVLEDLGLLDAALDVLVPQRGIAWIDSRERRLAAMPVEALGGQGFVSAEELLRSDLARLLHDAAVAAGVRYRFGDTVERLIDVDGRDGLGGGGGRGGRDVRGDRGDHGDNGSRGGVSATFRSGGEPETFDLVVGADGAHSRVRALRFGPEERYRRPLGLAHAWFTLAETAATPPLDGWNLVHNAPGRRAIAARPGHPGEQEVGLTFAAADLPARGDSEARFALLDEVFEGVGWRAHEFLQAAHLAPDFALDTYDQVHMPGWADGRVVLLGDAAWCASPLSGLGTALALRGADALAHALGDGSALTDDASWAAALADFERAMRPRATAAQKLIPGRVSMIAPRGRLGILVNALVMRVMQWPILLPVLSKVTGDRGHATEQPQQPQPKPAPTRA